MSESTQRAESLRETLLEWLVTDFGDLGGDALYEALSDVLTTEPAHGSADARRFVVWTRGLLNEKYAGLSRAEVTAVLGQLAGQVETARRSGRSASGQRADSRSASSLGQGGASIEQRGGARSPSAAGHTDASRGSHSDSRSASGLAHGSDTRSRSESVRSASISGAGPTRYMSTPLGGTPAVGAPTWHRAAEYSFVQVWTPQTARILLTFDHATDLQAFADALVRDQMVQLELDPPPPELSAVTLELAAAGEVPVMASAGTAAVGPGNRVVVAVQNMPPVIRRLAARRRAQLSASHGVVQTTSPSLPGNREPSAPGVAGPTGTPPPVGTFQRLATLTPPTGSRSVERDDARNAPPVEPRGFEPQGNEDDSYRVLPTASRRRRRAAALHAGQEADPDASVSRPGVDSRPGHGRPDASVSRPGIDSRPGYGRPDSRSGRGSQSQLGDHGEEPETAPPARGTPPPARSRLDEPPNDEPATVPRVGPQGAQALAGPAIDGIEGRGQRGTITGKGLDGGAAALLIRVAVEHPTAIVRIRTSWRQWTLAVREEAVVGIRMEPEDGDFSLRRAITLSGLVDPADLDEAMRAAAQRGEPLRDLLVSRRLLRYRQCESLERARTMHMLETLFEEPVESWEAVGYESFRGSPAAVAMFGPVAWARLKERCEQRSSEDLERIFAGRMLHRPSIRRDGYVDPSSLGLTAPEERLALEILDGATAVTNALTATQLARRAALALLCALDLAGLCHWEEVAATDTRVLRSWEALLAKDRALGSADPFDLIGAHWSADEVLIDRACEKTIKALDLDFIEASGNPNERAVAARVRKGLLAARDRLRDHDLRATTRERVTHPSERDAAVGLYEKQAEIAAFRGDHSQAIDSLRRVVELRPDHPTARTQLRSVIGGARR